MNIQYSLLTIFFTLIFSCAKMPIQSANKNDDILSGGSHTPKPNSTNNDAEDAIYPENSALYLGVPYVAKKDKKNAFNNYLIERTHLTISYNNTKNIPNWVGWHLCKNDLGSQNRTDGFFPDPLLPFEWIWVDANSYINSNFDRGHNCPSGDRTIDANANSQTFYMTNIIPQSPRFNQQPWANLEDYIRNILKNNNYEAYIYNGNLGIGGTNQNNEFVRKIKNNTGKQYSDGSYDSIWVPQYVFKIVIFLPEGNNDSMRIMANEGNDIKVLAVLCPNQEKNPQTATLWAATEWRNYITTIKSIEDSIAKYTPIEEADKYVATNPLNPPMLFLQKIPKGVINTKLKNMKWEILP